MSRTSYGIVVVITLLSAFGGGMVTIAEMMSSSSTPWLPWIEVGPTVFFGLFYVVAAAYVW
jgi:hypothetical protein